MGFVIEMAAGKAEDRGRKPAEPAEPAGRVSRASGHLGAETAIADPRAAPNLRDVRFFYNRKCASSTCGNADCTPSDLRILCWRSLAVVGAVRAFCGLDAD